MPPLISIAQARELVLAAVKPLAAESTPVHDALGRRLAADLSALTDVPPFSSSAMDGYAVQDGPAGRELPLAGESRAGTPAAHPLEPGSAIRISTGAQIPAGATAVIRQEDVEPGAETVRLAAGVAPGENIRPAGEVLACGQTALTAGTRLGPAELALAVSAGHGALPVAARPRVAVICTGDELREPGQPLGPGQIPNSNAPMLVALAQRAGAIAAPAVWLADDAEATRAGLAAALESSDVLVISGGVSVGPHDHVKPALADLGVRERFWGVALQPGKPTWFGVREEKLVFGLPGNPVSAAVTFTLFVAPALAALQGSHRPLPRRIQAALAQDVRRSAQREQALRVRIEHRSGAAHAVPNGPQGSHHITSLAGADGLALIPPGEGTLATGSAVEVEPL